MSTTVLEPFTCRQVIRQVTIKSYSCSRDYFQVTTCGRGTVQLLNDYWSILNETSTITFIIFSAVPCIIYLPWETSKIGGVLHNQIGSHTN